MTYYRRTGMNSGVGVGFFGLFVLGIGLLIQAMIYTFVAIITFVVWVVAAVAAYIDLSFRHRNT